MGGLALLTEARAAGLRVRVEGDRLIIRGPRSQEALAKRLLSRKAELMPVLRQTTLRSGTEGISFGAEDEAWVCRGIERDLGLPSGTLTLWEPIRSDYLSDVLSDPRQERRKKSGK
jgi:hypothetical protein